MTALTANVNASTDTFPVNSGTGIERGQWFQVDDELVEFVNFGQIRVGRADWAQDMTKLLVNRGKAGTTAASHLSGATLTPYEPDAPTGDAGGEGAGVLEDPGNVWAPDTAVTEGYRIKHTHAGDDHVFEATVAGTTADWAASFDELGPKYGPGALTEGDNLSGGGWLHIGIVGRLPESILPGLRPAVLVDDDGVVSVRNAAAPEDGEDLFRLQATVDGTAVPVFESQTDGDADWFLDQDAGAGFRFNVRDSDNVNVAGVEMTYDAFKVLVQGGSARYLKVTYEPFSIEMFGLPTADPGQPGQLFTDGEPSVGVPKTLKVSGG